MSDRLVNRLEEIAGVASVAVDLTDTGGGINVRLEPGADEDQVMERLRELLVAYGIRSADPKVKLGRPRRVAGISPSSDVEVAITPLRTGARVEVATKKIKSFRVVPANPSAIAQGLSDAWCQVIGRIPVEILKVSVSDAGLLKIVATDGSQETMGIADVSAGWERALTEAIGEALGAGRDSSSEERPLAANSSP